MDDSKVKVVCYCCGRHEIDVTGFMPQNVCEKCFDKLRACQYMRTYGKDRHLLIAINNEMTMVLRSRK